MVTPENNTTNSYHWNQTSANVITTRNSFVHGGGGGGVLHLGRGGGLHLGRRVCIQEGGLHPRGVCFGGVVCIKGSSLHQGGVCMGGGCIQGSVCIQGGVCIWRDSLHQGGALVYIKGVLHRGKGVHPGGSTSGG